MAATRLREMLDGYTLTTAEILYRLPDHPVLLQSFVWQEFDLYPRFPRLTGFLEFWRGNLDGELFKVTVAHRELMKPADLSVVGTELRLH